MEVAKISRAVSHRIHTDSKDQVIKFAENMIRRIDTITGRNPGLKLKKEREYFTSLLRKSGGSI